MSKLEDDLAATQTEFFDKRLPDDPDLVVIMANLLVENGVDKDGIAAFYSSPFILDAGNKRPGVQRFLINRFWTLQLLSVTDRDTVNERFSLINDGNIDDWLKVFVTGALPTILECGLPIKL